MKTVAIIQARLGSTRLPGKVLMGIKGKPLLWHVVNRVKQAKLVDEVIVAAPEGSDEIVEFCAKSWMPIYLASAKSWTPCFLGSESDVLSRYYHAAKWKQADVIVRITGDCPLIDPGIIDRVIEAYCATDVLFASNTAAGYIDGMDTEVFHFSLLEKAFKEAWTPYMREHLTTWMYWASMPKTQLCCTGHAPGLKLSVDTQEDLDRVRAIVAALGEDCRIEEIVKWWEEQKNV